MNTELNETIAQLISESRNPASTEIDDKSALEIVSIINKEDAKVAQAIKACLPQIAQAVDLISKAFCQGGRLIYMGAGTSGRLGVLDACECPPTFNVPESQVIGLIAGGKEAMFRAQEGAEDNIELGVTDLTQLNANNKDVVVGIAASGRTPYVIGALTWAKEQGISCVSISCNQDSPMAKMADIAITPIVGAEIISGSTRLKSGSAQKMVLNMLSTAAMIKTGKVYQNLMVDVKTSNQKLAARAVNIVIEATGCSKAQAQSLLSQTEQRPKLAILMQLTDTSLEQAKLALTQSKGHLKPAIRALL